MRIQANCKINIGLDVLERRNDGFHSLSTVMFPVKGLYDVLNIEKIQTPQAEFHSKGLMVDCNPQDNLCLKAYNLIKGRFPSIGSVSITLDKRVPFGAGLGGGSADATAVIVALNELFDLSISEQQLIELAAEIGSDTAFFVRNTPQLCSGRGEIMQPINVDLSGKQLMLIKPNVNISTREAYAGVRPALPEVALEKKVAQPIATWQECIKNDFEPHIFKAHPLLAQIKEELINAGALYAAMSGSGSTMFGIFDTHTKINSEQLKSYSPYIFKL